MPALHRLVQLLVIVRQNFHRWLLRDIASFLMACYYPATTFVLALRFYGDEMFGEHYMVFTYNECDGGLSGLRMIPLHQ